MGSSVYKTQRLQRMESGQKTLIAISHTLYSIHYFALAEAGHNADESAVKAV